MQKITQRYPGHQRVHLMIADGLILDKPTVVTTILGSCVSVTMHSPEKKIGAIFHAVMPFMPEQERAGPVQNPYKFVDSAIRRVVQAFARREVKPHQLEAKVFGGAQSMTTGEDRPGPTNIRTAFEMLTALKIKILASDVGGSRGRNLIFISDTGEVFIKTHRESFRNALQD